ncbi:MAG TPA: MFS transporter [Allosphingosinicella sp.]|jgi:EmrB/QacA subfamily drug resistance transporter
METTLQAPVGRGGRAGAGAWALAALSLCMLMSSLGTSIANVALPVLAQAFDASFQQVQWVVLAYLLSVTITVVGVGRLGDMVGRKRLLMAGILLFTAAASLAGLAPTLGLLIAARAVQGVGAAIMMALAVAMVGESMPPASTGKAMGLLGAMSAVGTALGPSLGGLLIAVAGWRSIFLIALPIGLLAFMLAHRHLPEAPATGGRGGAKFDKRGTILLGLTVGAFALSSTIGRGSFGAVNVALLGAAFAGLILFLWSQQRAAAPLMPLSTFRRPGIAAGLAMSFLVSTVLMATLVVGPFYLSRALALDAPAVGLVLSVGPIVVACAGIPAGRAADRFGPLLVTAFGLGGIALGCIVLSLVPATFGLFGYIPAIVILTLGYALFQTANNVAMMAVAEVDRRGLVSGLLNLSRNLGLIAGASAMGAAFAGAAGMDHIADALPSAVAAAARLTFGVAAMLILLALPFALRAVLPALPAQRVFRILPRQPNL